MLIPVVCRVAYRRVQRFDPAASLLIGELNSWNGTQAVRDRKRRVVWLITPAILGKVIPARPGSARTERMEGCEPGKLGDGDVGLSMLPRSTRLVSEVTEVLPIRRKV